jgi:TatD DNase family protein
MKIIDTHCHLDFSEFASDRDDVLKRARQNGLCGFVIPGVMRRTWDALIELCDQSSDMHYALGLHPMFIQTHELAHVENLREFLVNNSPIAIGEIGLDFQDRCLQIEKRVR